MKLNKLLCCFLLITTVGCNTKKETTQTTDIDKFFESYVPSAHPESDFMTGELSSDFSRYTLTTNVPNANLSDCEVTITFKLTVKSDENVFCKRRFENIEFESFETSGDLDKAEFIGIDSITYDNDDTKAIVYWTYTAEKDDEVAKVNEMSLIVLYKECEYYPS